MCTEKPQENNLQDFLEKPFKEKGKASYLLLIYTYSIAPNLVLALFVVAVLLIQSRKFGGWTISGFEIFVFKGQTDKHKTKTVSFVSHKKERKFS